MRISYGYGLALALAVSAPGGMAAVLATDAVATELAQAQPGASGTNQPTPSQPSLSEKLDKSDGVITPPSNVDPEMRQAPPNVGNSMPVIPPNAVNPDQPPSAPKPEAK
ncbi:MAG: hypothetical protein JWM36_1305 [Hyphomicrobiales bacterium]|nr:hypothetical protein [Hyphomicrobiales bacterium]